MNVFLTWLSAGFISLSAAAYTPPNVEYSANWTIETKDGQFANKVFYAANKERREMQEGGENMVLITRHDTNKVYMLMLDEGMYMEIGTGMPMGGKDDSADLNRYHIEQTEVAKEKVNGVDCTKYKIIMTDKKKPKEKFGGFYWLSKEGIMVKMDAIAVDKKSKDRIKIDVTDLVIKKQDPKLFEIPSGLQKISMPGF